MYDQAAAPGTDSTRASELEQMAGSSRQSIATTGDVIPVVPNLVATITSFLFMMVLPWACYWGTAFVIGEEGLMGDLAAMFMTATLLEDAELALGIAFLFLVIGMILQFWQHQKPFADRWPVALAFPAFWVLILPEFLVRQSPVFVWILLGTAIPLAFSVHWLAFVSVREAME
jgi:hypothetical protein